MFGRRMGSGDYSQYLSRRSNPYMPPASMPVGRGWGPISYSEPYPALVDPGYITDYPSGYRVHPYPVKFRRGYHTPFKPVDPYDLRGYELWDDPVDEAYYPRGRSRDYIPHHEYANPGWSPYNGDGADLQEPFYHRNLQRKLASPHYVTLDDVLRALENEGSNSRRVDAKRSSPGQYVLLDDALRNALQSPQLLGGAEVNGPREKIDRPMILVPSSYLANGDDKKISPSRSDSVPLRDDGIYVPLNIPAKLPLSKEDRSDLQAEREPVYLIRPDSVQPVRLNLSDANKDEKSGSYENSYPVVCLPANALANLLKQNKESRSSDAADKDQPQSITPSVRLIPVKQQNDNVSTISSGKSEVKPQSSSSEASGYPVFYIPASLLNGTNLGEENTNAEKVKGDTQSRSTDASIKIVPVTQFSDGGNANVPIGRHSEIASGSKKPSQGSDLKKHKPRDRSHVETQLDGKHEKAQLVHEKQDQPRLKKSFTPETAASLIQSVYKGYLVRRTQPLKYLREIARVRSKSRELQVQIREPEDLHRVCSNPQERLRLTEGIMALLLQLDVIQGVHPVVREFRKSAARELIQLQETVDDAVKQLSQQQLYSPDFKPDVKASKLEVAESDAGNIVGESISIDCADGVLADDLPATEIATKMPKDLGDVKQVKDGAANTHLQDDQMLNSADDHRDIHKDNYLVDSNSTPEEVVDIKAGIEEVNVFEHIVTPALGDEACEKSSFENDSLTAGNLVPNSVQIKSCSTESVVDRGTNKSDENESGSAPCEPQNQDIIDRYPLDSSCQLGSKDVKHPSTVEYTSGIENADITPHTCRHAQSVSERLFSNVCSEARVQGEPHAEARQVSPSPSSETVNTGEQGDTCPASASVPAESNQDSVPAESNQDSVPAESELHREYCSESSQEGPSVHEEMSELVDDEKCDHEAESGSSFQSSPVEVENLGYPSNDDQSFSNIAVEQIEESNNFITMVDMKVANEENSTPSEVVFEKSSDEVVGDCTCEGVDESPVSGNSCLTDAEKGKDFDFVQSDSTSPVSTDKGDNIYRSNVQKILQRSGKDSKVSSMEEQDVTDSRLSIRDSRTEGLENKDMYDLAKSVLPEYAESVTKIIDEEQGDFSLNEPMHQEIIHQQDKPVNDGMGLPEQSEPLAAEKLEGAVAEGEKCERDCSELRTSYIAKDSETIDEDVKNVCYTGSAPNDEPLKPHRENSSVGGLSTEAEADALKHAQSSAIDASRATSSDKLEMSNAQLLRVLSEENKMLKTLVNELMHCGKLQALSILHLQERLGRLETLCSLRKPQKTKSISKSKVSKKK